MVGAWPMEMKRSAFLRIETVDDLADAVRLSLDGWALSYEPVVGSLWGLSKPVRLYVQTPDNPGWPKEIRPRQLTQRVIDTDGPATVVQDIMSTPYQYDNIALDLKDGWRRKWLDYVPAFERLVGLLNIWNNRMLTRVEITEAVQTLIPTAQPIVPWGDPEWKALQSKFGAMLLCYSEPDFKDLLTEGGGHLINAKLATQRCPWFKGVSAGGHVLMGNRSLVGVTQVTLADLNHLAQYTQMRNAGENAYKTLVNLATRTPLSWFNQNLHLGLTAIEVLGLDEVSEEQQVALEMHALYGARKAADARNLPRSTPPTLIRRSRNASVHYDGNSLPVACWGHGPGLTITYDTKDIPNLAQEAHIWWGNFLGARFMPIT